MTAEGPVERPHGALTYPNQMSGNLLTTSACRPQTRGMTTNHAYTTTRTSPFGHYGACACGWTTRRYFPTAQAAYQSVRDHVAAQAGRHEVHLEAIPVGAGNYFQAVCSCGWAGPLGTTNAVMGRGRRHATAANRPAGQ